MKSFSIGLLVAAVLVLLTAAPVAAYSQTNIKVLGTGNVAYDSPLAPTDAAAQLLKTFMPATLTVGTVVQQTCATAVAPPAGILSTCLFKLSALPLTSTFQSLALTVSETYADGGTVESAKSVAPFALAKAVPLVVPSFSATPIRPALP